MYIYNNIYKPKIKKERMHVYTVYMYVCGF